MGSAEGTDKKEETGKFGNVKSVLRDSIKKTPEETQKKYNSVSSKSISLKRVGEEVLSSSSKDELKANLPKAIVVKKNLKKDVENLYTSFKRFEETHDNSEDINNFKQACNKVIRHAQKSHEAIRNKVYKVYDKKR